MNLMIKEIGARLLVLCALVLVVWPQGAAAQSPPTRLGFTPNRRAVSVPLSALDTSWVYFAHNPAGGSVYAFPVVSTADTSIDGLITPPWEVYNTGAASIEELAALAGDSLRVDVFGLNHEGYVIKDDSVSVGSVTDATAVLGDGRPHRITLTAQFDNVWGYAARVINASNDSLATTLKFIPTE